MPVNETKLSFFPKFKKILLTSVTPFISIGNTFVNVFTTLITRLSDYVQARWYKIRYGQAEGLEKAIIDNKISVIRGYMRQSVWFPGTQDVFLWIKHDSKQVLGKPLLEEVTLRGNTEMAQAILKLTAPLIKEQVMLKGTTMESMLFDIRKVTATWLKKPLNIAITNGNLPFVRLYKDGLEKCHLQLAVRNNKRRIADFIQDEFMEVCVEECDSPKAKANKVKPLIFTAKSANDKSTNVKKTRRPRPMHP